MFRPSPTKYRAPCGRYRLRVAPYAGKRELGDDNMTNQVILFNGPKLVGKDIAATHLETVAREEWGITTIRVEYKDALISLVCSFYDVPREEFLGLYEDRDTKEVPVAKLDNQSPRQAMIHVSEDIIKPAMGKDCFGHALVSSLLGLLDRGMLEERALIIIGSAGFPEEAVPLQRYFGAENVHLIRVFRDGHTYGTDSRSYIDPTLFRSCVDLYNIEGREADYLRDVVHTAKALTGMDQYEDREPF